MRWACIYCNVWTDGGNRDCPLCLRPRTDDSPLAEYVPEWWRDLPRPAGPLTADPGVQWQAWKARTQ